MTLLRCDYRMHAGANDRCLLRCNFFDRVTKILFMIHGDGRDCDHIGARGSGGIQSSAQTSFEDG